MEHFRKTDGPAEIYRLALTIQSIRIEAPEECDLWVEVELDKNNTHATQSVKYTPGCLSTQVTGSLSFKLSFSKQKSKYLPKIVSFRLMQSSRGRTTKNGEAIFDVSSLINSPIDQLEISLAKATDKKASMRISGSLSKVPKMRNTLSNQNKPRSRTVRFAEEKRVRFLDEDPPELRFSMQSWKSVIRLQQTPCGESEISYRVHSDDEEPMTIETLFLERHKSTVKIPPTSIDQVQPNIKSKTELIKQKELESGISRKGGSCKGCFIF